MEGSTADGRVAAARAGYEKRRDNAQGQGEGRFARSDGSAVVLRRG